MADYKAIMTLLLDKRSYSEIVSIIGCSRRDVSQATKAITARGFDADIVAGLGTQELQELFPDWRKNVSAGFVQPDFAKVVRSMKATRHYTLHQAWHRYVQGPESTGKKYGYTQFCQLFNDFAATHVVVATLHHIPGLAHARGLGRGHASVARRGQRPDHQGLPLRGVLPYSGMMFCRAYPNMKQDAWNGAHGEGFEAFGGVSQTVVPDNAATATNRHSAADGAQEVNARDQELAAHFSTAIVPARSKHPPRQGGGRGRGQRGQHPGHRIPGRGVLGFPHRAEHRNRGAGT